MLVGLIFCFAMAYVICAVTNSVSFVSKQKRDNDVFNQRQANYHVKLMEWVEWYDRDPRMAYLYDENNWFEAINNYKIGQSYLRLQQSIKIQKERQRSVK